MKVEDEILQAIRNFSAIETERFKIIMTSMTDFNAKVTELTELMKTVSAKQTETQTSLKTAVTDLGTAVASGHSTLLDQMMATLTTFSNGLTAMGTANDTMQAELKTALAAVPTSPAVTPTA